MGKIKLGLLLLLMTLVGTPMTGYGMQLSESELYARSACLMDADSGRVLYSKNSEQKLPMASTTKIMTCILALEDGRMDDLVTVSAYAASQPKVHMGAKTGEQFYLQDLLYALMLNSDNDAAVMIAEQVGGSVEGFAEKMNLKARELGCDDTYFITPNGLDAENKNGIHSTTAKDLAYFQSGRIAFPVCCYDPSDLFHNSCKQVFSPPCFLRYVQNLMYLFPSHLFFSSPAIRMSSPTCCTL